MTPREEYPELGQMFAAWFHPDWDLEVPDGGDWPDIIDAFVEGQGLGHARGALQELDQLLATDADDESLDETTWSLGCYYTPEDLGMRAWLTAMRGRLAADIGAEEAR